MSVNIDVFLKQQYEDSKLSEAVKTEELYTDIDNKYLSSLFAILQQEFNRLFGFLYYKSEMNRHYNAEESRQLLKYIKLYDDMYYVLKESSYSFQIIDVYLEMINQCTTFLVQSGGSVISDDLLVIDLLEYEPIFNLTQTVNTPNIEIKKTYPLQLIGEGSYAQVFKYKDEFYQKTFVIKRAKSNLTSKEVERFKKEYQVMKELNSPYVIDVYGYDNLKNEYYMEYADETLFEYITKNNTKLLIQERKNIVNQVLRGFRYLHSKNLFHRDISFTNILLIHYDDVTVVKLSDFGLVKDNQSNLTSFGSEVKGSLNDSNLSVVGFNNYSIEYETFALTRLILFIMTGKYNLHKIDDKKIKQFVDNGINQNLSNRYKSIEELKEAYDIAFPL